MEIADAVFGFILRQVKVMSELFTRASLPFKGLRSARPSTHKKMAMLNSFSTHATRKFGEARSLSNAIDHRILISREVVQRDVE